MEEIPRLEHWRIERLAVERHERAGPSETFGNDAQHRTLAGEVRHQMLLADESTLFVEPSASDQERVRPRPAIQTRCFEVEEHERHGRRRSADECCGW